MAEYIVSVDGYDDEFYKTLEEAEKAYETWKVDLMSEGHEHGTEIIIYEVKPIKKAKSVIDEERMKINNPKDEGYDFLHWAKWDEDISVKNSLKEVEYEC